MAHTIHRYGECIDCVSSYRRAWAKSGSVREAQQIVRVALIFLVAWIVSYYVCRTQ